jgi:hypothetical protein
MSDLLKEYIRQFLERDSVISESGERGFAFEQILISELAAQDIDATPAAGNNNTISDLGLDVRGKAVGCEVKLSPTDNLGAVRKENFDSLVWTGSKFVGIADKQSELYELAKSLISTMNKSEDIKSKMKLLEDHIGRLMPLSAGPWDLLSSFGNDSGNDAQKAVYAIMRGEPERFPVPKGMKPLPPGGKQLSSPSSTIIDGETIRKIISGKKAPNGAPTDYIIIGVGQVKPKGYLYHLGRDPLNTGAPLYEPGGVGVEIRWAAAGGEGSSRRFSFNFKTKATGETPPGLPFNSGKELADILRGQKAPTRTKKKK